MMENLALHQDLNQQVVRLFRRRITGGWFYRLWAGLRRRNPHLLELEQTMRNAEVKNSHYGGVHSVNIDRIRGTEGKSNAFDGAFHPIKETTRGRWLSIAREKLLGHGLPPVELLDVDGTYYVRDGHHRISVARSLGEDYIDAEIIVMDLNRRIR